MLEPSPETGADRICSPCTLCPRLCEADRMAGHTGVCGAGTRVRMYRYGLHHGEEPPISGSRGSGTLFFSHCPLNCIYCQNWRWSQDNEGEDLDVAELASRFRHLRRDGAHNLNLVAPTPWLPWIREALIRANSGPEHLPVVFNTSGYERVATLEAFNDVADIYLTDLRYAQSATALEGSKAPDYVETARAALMAMLKQTGPWNTGADELARSGTLCRVLVLPGHEDEAIANLRWLAAHAGQDVPVAVMAQYRPAWRAAAGGAPWNRVLRRDDYERVCDAVADLDLPGWVQDFEDSVAAPLAGFNMAPGYSPVLG